MVERCVQNLFHVVKNFQPFRNKRTAFQFFTDSVQVYRIFCLNTESTVFSWFHTSMLNAKNNMEVLKFTLCSKWLRCQTNDGLMVRNRAKVATRYF